MVNVRRNYNALTDEERTRFLDAVFELKATKSPSPHEQNPDGNVYDDFVAMHSVAFFSDVAHHSANFLPWHRQYLLEFENALNRTAVARGGSRICVPYWDWTADRDTDAALWSDRWLGGNGTGLLQQVQRGRFGVPDADLDRVLSAATLARLRAGGRFQDLKFPDQMAVWEELKQGLAQASDHFKDRWMIMPQVDERPFLTRNFALPLTSSLPRWAHESDAAQQERRARDGVKFVDRGMGMLDALDEPAYDTFVTRFELDQHTFVHRAVGGDMDGSASPNDPVFWLHHSFVDKIWTQWHAMHPTAAPYLPSTTTGHHPGFNTKFGPWNTMSAADLIDTAKLGYVYG